MVEIESGYSIERVDFTKTKCATRGSDLGRHGRLKHGGDVVGLSEADPCGSATPASPPGCYGARERQQAAQTSSSPPHEARGDLHNDEEASAAAAQP